MFKIVILFSEFEQEKFKLIVSEFPIHSEI